MAGAILCLDVVIPAGPRILHFLRPHIPLWIVEAAHMLTGLVGVLLLMLACGIESRKHSAWKMTLWAHLSRHSWAPFCRAATGRKL